MTIADQYKDKLQPTFNKMLKCAKICVRDDNGETWFVFSDGSIYSMDVEMELDSYGVSYDHPTPDVMNILWEDFPDVLEELSPDEYQKRSVEN